VVGSQVLRRVFFLTHPLGAYTAQLAGSCARQEFRTPWWKRPGPVRFGTRRWLL